MEIKSITDKYNLQDPDLNSGNAENGMGARNLNNFLRLHVTRVPNGNPIIAIFDFDQEGYSQFKGLDNYTKLSESLLQHNVKKNIFVKLLTIPDFRKDFIDFSTPSYCFVSTELLYNDNIIPSIYKKSIAPDSKYFQFHSSNKEAFVKETIKRVTKKDLKGFEINFNEFSRIISLYYS